MTNTDFNAALYGCSKSVPLGTLERCVTDDGKTFYWCDINGGCRLVLILRKADDGSDKVVVDLYMGQIDRNSGHR
jgi:hypothetical protein